MSRDPLSLAGGQAIRYSASIITDQRKKSVQETDPIKKEEGIKIGLTVRKNHCIPSRNPYVKTDYFAIFGEGIEQYLPLIDRFVEAGIIAKAGAYFRDMDEDGKPKEVNGVKLQFQGKQAFRDYLVANDDYFRELKSKLSGTFIQHLSEEEVNAMAQAEKEDEVFVEQIIANPEEIKPKKAK